MNNNQIKTILFDLDGTLADTAPDLADALNQVLVTNGRPALPFETIRPHVSHGARALIELSFALNPEHHQFEPLWLQLLDVYRHNIANKTRLFPGMAEVLDQLEANHKNWGVVTNKPEWLTDPLMAALNLKERAACIVSGDTLAERKPDPAPLIHACILTGSNVDDCVYVGDAERDIIAGHKAGMKTLVALFGYIGEHESPADWGADNMIHTPQEILHWIENQ